MYSGDVDLKFQFKGIPRRFDLELHFGDMNIDLSEIALSGGGTAAPK